MKYHPQNWKHSSPESSGLHAVITPENSECKVVRIFRLNLYQGRGFKLDFGNLEIIAGLISGTCRLDEVKDDFRPLDAFYMPGGETRTLTALTDSVLYIGAAPYEGIGEFHVRRHDCSLPRGDVRQCHGNPPFERDVFMALNQETAASRLIAGFTWSNNGAWTSWPPHQHEKDLEEVYCYFNIHSSACGLHLSYLRPGDQPVGHLVSSGDFVEAPVGYHPTVALPGGRNCYFWVLAALSGGSRRYDLAVNDPDYN